VRIHKTHPDHGIQADSIPSCATSHHSSSPATGDGEAPCALILLPPVSIHRDADVVLPCTLCTTPRTPRSQNPHTAHQLLAYFDTPISLTAAPQIRELFARSG